MGDVLLQFSGGQDNFFCSTGVLPARASVLYVHFQKAAARRKAGVVVADSVAAYVFFLLYTVWPGLEMRIPVLAYAVVITLMLVFALRRYRGTTTISFNYSSCRSHTFHLSVIR